ncbi:hypothetical protein CASFOL_023866 [Castilleja foliolosa]|uniref:Uncharacterized protein n=1 Tax=Castilleja foliolosa TaxID=1961234 RepID=A0ABD3CMS9_9LAMI
MELLQRPVTMEGLENYPFKVDALLKYGTDMTSLALKGKFDKMIGREVELDRLTQVLCKRRKNNACLLGDPGVGKTAIVEGLAMKIADCSAPQKLIGKKVFEIDMARLVAGIWTGEFEKRLVKLIEEVVNSNGSVILFIDELHTLIGGGASSNSSLDAANILKPALARGDLKCIGATTLVEYRKYIEKDPALKRRFEPIQVPEPSPEQAIEILKGVRNKYETYHDVSYTDSALIAAVDLSNQFLSDRLLPDKAIDLIDEVGARIQLRKRKAATDCPVTETDIQQMISMWTGIPLEKVTTDESKRLLEMETVLKRCLIGQDEAVSSVSRAIRRARVGLRDMSKPVASFLFTGPTGVGKTQLVKTLAEEYYGSKKALVRLDMSEYKEPHSVSRLFGSPPGYHGNKAGGQLTNAIIRRPHTLVLFDEIEKAHKRVFDVLLQILDDGRLTDGQGRVADFKHAIIILTSNIGGRLNGDYDEVKRGVGVELKEFFKPEFLNRLDEIVVFRPLKKEHLSKVVDVMLADFYRMVETKRIKVEVGDGFKEKLVSEGCNSRYGARPLRRAITRLLEDNLAERILNGTVTEGQRVRVDVDSAGEVLIEVNETVTEGQSFRVDLDSCGEVVIEVKQ